MADFERPKRMPVTVLSVKQIKKNRYQVKVKENEYKLDNLTHDGVRYNVVKTMTRGRYIMEKVVEA